MKPPRVVALGQPVAGDDGVALQILQRLREGAGEGPASAEFYAVSDCSKLIELCRHDAPMWIIDAVVGAGEPGQVLMLNSEDLGSESSCSVSSHGLDVMQALEICQVLYPEQICPEVRVFAITIVPPRLYEQRLSAPVAEAVERCVASVREQLRAFGSTSHSSSLP